MNKNGSSRKQTIPGAKADDLLSQSEPSCGCKQTILRKQTILVKAADLFTFIFINKSRRSQPTYFGTNADDPVPKRTILTYVFWVSKDKSNILGFKQTILISNRGMKADDPESFPITFKFEYE